MTSDKTEGLFTLTKPVVMTFPQLFEPKRVKKNGKETGEPKFSANFIFPPDSEELAAMKALAAKLARDRWPGKPFFLTTQEGVKIQEIFFPFASGDKAADARLKKGKKDGEYMRGKVIMASRSKYEPRLSYISGKSVIELEGEAAKLAAKGKFYNGVEVLAQFNFLPYDAVGETGKPGVTAYLNAVSSTGKGVRITGGQTASETFKGYVGSVSAEDPTATGADDDLGGDLF